MRRLVINGDDFALTQGISRGIRGDGEDPRAQPHRGDVATSSPNERQEGGLQQILGEGLIPDEPPKKSPELGGEAFIEYLEGRFVPLAEAQHERVI